VVLDLLQRAAAATPTDARAHLAAVLRAASDQIWVARNAARIFATHVGDRDAARAVIGALQPLTCREWRLVAAAWTELGDATAARACLERAATNARVPLDLCIVALGYRDAQYEDEARLLVDGAARVASHAMDAWVIASCYRDAFLDPDRAREVLLEGMRDAVGVDEIVTCTRAFAAHDAGAAEIAGYLARAERVASTVHDWIALAAGFHTILRDGGEAIRCVNQAALLATSPQDERDIALARGRVVLELLDDERPKLPPSKLLAAGARAFAWDRDPDRLLGWLRARIPRTSISTLARRDQFFANDDLVTLLELQKTGNVPHPLPAYLDILRDVARGAGDHLLRAFACTLLCIDDAAAIESERVAPLLVNLLESCLALGPDAVAGAAALFAALADAYEARREHDLVIVAELGLVLAAAWLDPTDPRIAPLLERARDDDAYADAARTWALLASRMDLTPLVRSP
jgi:hypothetical protein